MALNERDKISYFLNKRDGAPDVGLWFMATYPLSWIPN